MQFAFYNNYVNYYQVFLFLLFAGLSLEVNKSNEPG